MKWSGIQGLRDLSSAIDFVSDHLHKCQTITIFNQFGGAMSITDTFKIYSHAHHVNRILKALKQIQIN